MTKKKPNPKRPQVGGQVKKELPLVRQVSDAKGEKWLSEQGRPKKENDDR